MSLNQKNSASSKKLKSIKGNNYKDKSQSKFKKISSTTSITHPQPPTTVISINAPSELQKVQDELAECKKQCEDYQHKLKELKEKESNNESKYQIITSAIQSTYDILLEIIEMFFSPPKSNKDISLSKQQENISCSLDIYDASSIINNEDDKRTVLIEQIQQILVFKLNFLNKVFKLGLDRQIEKVKNWNISNFNNSNSNNNISNITYTKENKENLSTISNLSNLSTMKNKLQPQNNFNTSNSSCNLLYYLFNYLYLE